jgi:glycosyltransferase involved in cell wall biosynthesis
MIVDGPIQVEATRSSRRSPAPADRAGLPLVSIVTPSYNQGRFIRETIESVLEQDYPNIEYWVIDGGSSDDTRAILHKFERDSRLHWVSEPDCGQSDAINKGLALCHGELFGWLNSDDRLLPGAVRQVVEAWLAGDSAAILYGRARLIDLHGHDLGYCPAQSSHMTLKQILNLRYFLAQPATFAPIGAVRQAGGLDSALHYAMDLDLWIRLAERLPIRHVPYDLAQFRLHPGSKSMSLASRFIADVTTVLDRAAQRGLLSTHQARLRSQIYAMRIYLMPEAVDLNAALASLQAAYRIDRSVGLEGLLVLIKALIRLAVGERVWSWVRLLQVKIS